MVSGFGYWTELSRLYLSLHSGYLSYGHHSFSPLGHVYVSLLLQALLWTRMIPTSNNYPYE